MRRVLVGLALASFALTGCGGSSDDGKPKEFSSDADQSKFAPEVKARIDGMRLAKDCGLLQREFDIADGNNNLAVMTYADDSMKFVGCYK